MERLVGASKDFVELHELWLRVEHRRKGLGKRFFRFFEGFVAGKGFDSVVYYADHPAALAICRKRGYKEAFGATSPGRTYYVFYLSLKEREQ